MIKNIDRTEPTDFDREKYADWLWRGLRSIYASTSSNRARAFDPFHRLILQQESIVEGLARFYEDHVSESCQLMFRQAIGDVLRDQANNHEAPLPAIKDLIYLLARVKATESLSALVPTVGNGLVGRQHPEILYETVAVLKALAPSMYAYEAAFDLVNCANFDDGYLFEAMKVLVECEPSRAATIVLTLEPRLSQLQKDTLGLDGDEWKAFCEAAEDWAQHIMTVAPVSWLIDLWQEADHRRDQIWLFKLLFGNKAKPISLHEDESPDGIFIECEQKKYLLRVSDKEYNTMKHIRCILATKEVRRWTRDPNDIVNRFQVPERGLMSLGALIYRNKEIFGWIRDPSDKVNRIQVPEGGGLRSLGALIDRNVVLIAPRESGCQIPAL